MRPSLIIVTSALVVLVGCHRNLSGPDYTPPSPPTGLRTYTGDNFIELTWFPNPEHDVAGYNVYVSDQYNGPYQPIGSTYSAYFKDRGAMNGVTYYYAVTAFDFDGNESDLSKDVAYDVPRPEGYDVQLSDFRSIPVRSGYDFSSYSVVPYDDNGSDIWYEYYNGDMYMDVRTDTDIQDMGPTNSILDISRAPASGWSPTHDVLLTPGHTYVVWTFDDHYAKFRVSALSPVRVSFDWAYQLQESNPMLKRAVVGSGQIRPSATSSRDN
jgi:hypothetical protein